MLSSKWTFVLLIAVCNFCCLSILWHPASFFVVSSFITDLVVWIKWFWLFCLTLVSTNPALKLLLSFSCHFSAATHITGTLKGECIAAAADAAATAYSSKLGVAVRGGDRSQTRLVVVYRAGLQVRSLGLHWDIRRVVDMPSSALYSLSKHLLQTSMMWRHSYR